MTSQLIKNRIKDLPFPLMALTKYNIIRCEHYSACFTVRTLYTNDLLFTVHNEKEVKCDT